MANTIITRRCGHTETVQMYGKMSERDRREHFESTKLCKDCWQAERTQESEHDAKASTRLDLPALTGSDKQVAWATSLRLTKLSELDGMAVALAAHPTDDPRKERIATQQAALREHYIGITSAADWIDNRSEAVMDDLRALASK